MRFHVLERLNSFCGNSQRFGGFVVRVFTQKCLKAFFQRSFLFFALRIEIASGPFIQQILSFAVQVIGSPVGGNIRAVSPNRTHFLSAHTLPNILSVFDVVSGEKNVSRFVNHLFGHRWRFLINLSTVKQEHGKRNSNHQKECNPKSFVSHNSTSLMINNWIKLIF